MPSLPTWTVIAGLSLAQTAATLLYSPLTALLLQQLSGESKPSTATVSELRTTVGRILHREPVPDAEVWFMLEYLIPGVIAFAGAWFAHLSGLLRSFEYEIFQPFRGGTSFIAFQALGWIFYGTSAVSLIVWLAHPGFLPQLVSFWGATGAFLGQILICLSIPFFDSSASSPGLGKCGKAANPLLRVVSNLQQASEDNIDCLECLIDDGLFRRRRRRARFDAAADQQQAPVPLDDLDFVVQDAGMTRHRPAHCALVPPTATFPADSSLSACDSVFSRRSPHFGSSAEDAPGGAPHGDFDLAPESVFARG